jgi:eukaryotic-like serine/threonine-protein kinase
MPELRVIKLFVASPGDVMQERKRLDAIVARLNTAFKAAAQFDCFRWERSSYTANFNFQDQIIEPAKCDIVIVIFGNRLGSELPEDFTRRLPDNTAYPSGTAYELLSALAAAEQRGKPDVYVFRKTDEPHSAETESAEAEAAREAARHEKKRLDAFFGRWFRTEAGGFRRAFQQFADPDDFERQADSLLRQWAEKSLRMGPSWRIDRDGSPFRGLKAFDARQSRVYFGRDRKVGRAVEELVRAPQRERGRPFLLVVGPSGSGKSSLVRAGVVPRFTAAGIVPEVDQWRIAVMRPNEGATAISIPFRPT